MRSRGQTMVEFALISMLLIIFVLGIMDFAYLFSGRLAAYEAARNAARYAATHPSSWSNASPPAASSIQGHLVLNSSPAAIKNDDAHVTIAYYLPGSGAATLCGQYSATSGTFTAVGAYTQTTCLVPGTTIQVSATYTYTFITPLLSAAWRNLTLTTTASAIEEI